MDSYDERIDRVAQAVPELFAYQQWLREQAALGTRDYLFAEERPRFEPRRQDVVVAVPDLVVDEDGPHPALRHGSTGTVIALTDVSAAQAKSILAHIDGKRCLLEVRLDAEVAPPVMSSFLRATFGRVIMAPAAISALEGRLSGVEIARFPSVPYNIVRSYWQNMIDVLDRVPDRVESDVLRLLARLHVVALMGGQLNSFYKPASPGADHDVAPGALFLETPHVVRDVFISGPRVNAALLGGEAYHAALYDSVGDGDALTRGAELRADKQEWGRVVVARSERDTEPKAWFCPPRPLTDSHFETLRNHLDAALTADDDKATITSAARFHWCFVRLHPFHCGNQSLAMNLVGAALRRRLAASIPHLILDHVALRLEREAYETIFTRAVASFAVPGDPGARLATLMDRNRRAYQAISNPTAADEDASRYALLR